jgi:hypothetical protein
MQVWQQAGWIAASAKPGKAILWRAVEAQHVVATMSLVDTLEEQYLLEQLLEASKPPVPQGMEKLDFLIFTPFRYTSPYPSRFRKANAPGVWYGAFDQQTACAEVGYWRWRFVMDSEALREGELVSEHSLFQARVSGRHIDLCSPPWDALAATWRHPRDYSACQDLADHAREQGLDWISYSSARQPEGLCAAVFAARALKLHEPSRKETWVCKVTAKRIIFRHGLDGFSFEPEAMQ